jgi:GH25 family lysozyme M1 (1,4-beta-N-acetylmuramidase)
MASADLPFGIDVSRYQGVINWDVVAAHQPKVEFVAIRAAISWGYKDTYFDANWAGARRVGIPRSAYHVIYPTEDPVRQMTHFLNCLGGDIGELPLSLDVELSHDATPAQYQANLLRALKYLQEKTQRKPMIYSRASFINYYVTGTGATPTWYKNYDWWLAQYLLSGVEHPGPPTLPTGVPRNRVIIHQSSDRGTPFGVQSSALDYNRWQFELAHLKHYAGLSISQPETSPFNTSATADSNTDTDTARTLQDRIKELEEKLRNLLSGK